ncbi:LuxR C-terminal-related transcriptional regulator [Shewanella schlegeliana]|uniref:HTH luxR-type domain-containing protein n=1 Tax=Shewanella schlegeliana TaxID=190308 RepID=A0ABS1T0M6_9GAMM|nr:LuxR C-terminal-related transcriptional regulator [Shewanella schlegeliana]MBL4913101.1 hypothetical protein [Shewanella schlegeliana]MCL1111115.1 LuxR C-terminal-related transcriptional regulator [Shewanella schlegeliana]GIU28243.1 hypothetical protein TUM4433_16180 [Shewanella schlegeliana]
MINNTQQTYTFEPCCELNNVAKELGFLSALYFVDFEPGSFTTDSKRGVQGGYKKLNAIICSDQIIKQYCDEYWRRYVADDPYFLASKKSHFYLWPYESGHLPQPKILQMMQGFGYGSKLSICFPLYSNQLIKGWFILLSERGEQANKEWFLQNQPQIERRLKEFHLEAVDLCSEQVFPYQDLGVVSKKGRCVLSLIAEGYTRTQVSEKLFISERGVDYHIDKLKCTFDCSNVTSLIAKSVRLKVI